MQTTQYTDGSYLEKVEDWHVSDSPWKARNVYTMITRNQLEPHSIHDVGCGAGQILVELHELLGPEVQMAGFDISPQAIALAKPRENEAIHFFQADYLNEGIPTPDVLLLLDVFEHVPDYLGFLTQLREKSHYVVFHIPLDIVAKAVIRHSNYMMEMRTAFGHLHYFTKETALATLKDVGFEVIDHFYTDDFDTSDWWKREGGLRTRIINEVRMFIKRFKPGVSAAIFPNYSVMVLAKGDR